MGVQDRTLVWRDHAHGYTGNKTGDCIAFVHFHWQRK